MGREVDFVAASIIAPDSLDAIDRGDFAAARCHLEEDLAIARVSRLHHRLATPLMYFAALAAAQGRPGRAMRHSGASRGWQRLRAALPLG